MHRANSRSDETVRRDVLRAAEVLARDSETLAGRGVDAWDDPRLRRLVKRAIAARRILRRTLSEEQMTLPGFEADEEGCKLRKLKRAVRLGVAQRMFPVGNVIADTWTDLAEKVSYDAPWMVVAYREVMLSCGETRLGAVLLRKFVAPFKVQYDAADGVNAYGSGCFDLSDLSAWLNSEEGQPTWWFARHNADEEPAYAREKAGYLAGCSPALREVVAEIMLEATVMDEGAIVCGKTACKMFVPSPEELNVDVTRQDSLYAGKSWDYFRDTPQHPDAHCVKRIFRDEKGNPQRCWTRAPNEMRGSWLWMITPEGDADVSNAHAEHAAIVACVVA